MIVEWQVPRGGTARKLGEYQDWPAVHQLAYSSDRALAAAYTNGEADRRRRQRGGDRAIAGRSVEAGASRGQFYRRPRPTGQAETVGVVPELDGGTIYDLRVKDFVELQTESEPNTVRSSPMNLDLINVQIMDAVLEHVKPTLASRI